VMLMTRAPAIAAPRRQALTLFIRYPFLAPLQR
jgi:hypothetical protein